MHLPNGSKIFIEASNEPEHEVKGLDTLPFPPNPENSFVVLLTNVNNINSYQVGDTVLFSSSDAKILEGNVYRILSIGTGSGRIRLWPEDKIETLPVSAVVVNKGKIRRITSWVELPCVQSIDKEGNEQNWYTYQCLNSGREERQKTTKSALFMSYTLAHDPGNPAYSIMKSREKSKTLMGAYMHIPRAKELRYWSGGVSFDDVPNTAVNEMETVTLRMAIRNGFKFLPSS